MAIKRVIGYMLVAVALIGVAVVIVRARETHTTEPDEQLVDTALLANITRPSKSSVQLAHIGDGLVPPTNKWFSSIALSETSLAVFPMPYSARIVQDGIEYSIPRPIGSDKAIMGAHTAAVKLTIPGATDYKLTYYDDLVIRVGVYRDADIIGEYTLAQGVPYVNYRAAEPQSVQITSPYTVEFTDAAVRITDQNTMYRVVSDAPVSNLTDLSSGQRLSIFGYIDGMPEDILTDAALRTIESSRTEYKITAREVTTTLHYQLSEGRQTIFAAMPHQSIRDTNPLDGSYESIYGDMKLYKGTGFTFSVPRINPKAGLDVTGLSDSEKSQLKTQLESDIATTTFDAVDTYFGGKELYRAAQLYDIAYQLDEKALADALYVKMKPVIESFFTPNNVSSFYYDESLKGIVGTTASFGSQDFNDHHFQYGYFMNASALIGKHNQAFVQSYAATVNLLAADIASNTTQEFPRLRVFDIYAGHSWASGNGAFADGNNQESSSEAIHAWVGLGAWAEVVQYSQLQRRATWLLSNEYATSMAYWVQPDLQAKAYDAYSYPIVSINWGGKRDFATFFSAEPSAIFGIQLIPMNPTLYRNFTNSERSALNLTRIGLAGSYSGALGDYILLYGIKAGLVENPIQSIMNRTPENIDDANSKTYMLALVMSEK